MGEAKNKQEMMARVPADQEPLTREELKQLYGDLQVQYQKATEYIRRLTDELQRRDADQVGMILGMLFKVMEHPEMYSDDFVSWAAGHIESALRGFISETEKEESPKDEA